MVGNVGLAQLEGHLLYQQKVRGSIPLTSKIRLLPINFDIRKLLCKPLAKIREKLFVA